MANSGKKKLSGFTLIELIVVIAIIGILSGILIPNMVSYIRRGRLKSVNAEAKVIFNSIQTICQEFEFKERGAKSTEFYGKDGNGAVKTGSMIIQYDRGDLTYAGSTMNGVSSNADKNEQLMAILQGNMSDSVVSSLARETPNPDDNASSFMTRLATITADLDEYCFCAYIQNYQVKAVICASGSTSEYLGGYPNKSNERGGFSTMGAAGSSVTDAELQADSFTAAASAPFTFLKNYVADSNGGSSADY